MLIILYRKVFFITDCKKLLNFKSKKNMQQNVDKKLLNFKSKKNMQQNVDKAIIFGIRQQIVIKHLKNLFTIK
jgi:hypothetical protein